NGFRDRAREVGVVDRIRRVRTDVVDGVPHFDEPRDDPAFQRERGGIASDRDPHRRAFAFATTFSTLNPSFSRTVSPGAEAPKRANPIESPRSPTHRFHPTFEPASIERRTGIPGASPSSR